MQTVGEYKWIKIIASRANSTSGARDVSLISLFLPAKTSKKKEKEKKRSLSLLTDARHVGEEALSSSADFQGNFSSNCVAHVC